MDKFIIFLMLLTIGCSQQNEQHKEKQEHLPNENKAVVISDTVIGITVKSDRIKVIQFHIYYDGALCGYANCWAIFEDETLTTIDTIQVADIINTKGFIIKNLNITGEGCEFNLNVSVGNNYHSLSFSYQCCANNPHIAVYSFAEVSPEALRDKNSGVRIAKGKGPQFLPIRFVDN